MNVNIIISWAWLPTFVALLCASALALYIAHQTKPEESMISKLARIGIYPADAIHILELEANYEKINWEELLTNPNAIHILELEANYEKINWEELLTNPNAIHILELEANYEKINWEELLTNPNAIYLEDLLDDNISANQLYVGCRLLRSRRAPFCPFLSEKSNRH